MTVEEIKAHQAEMWKDDPEDDELIAFIAGRMRQLSVEEYRSYLNAGYDGD
jgi:hypothetical protein